MDKQDIVKSQIPMQSNNVNPLLAQQAYIIKAPIPHCIHKLFLFPKRKKGPLRATGEEVTNQIEFK